MDIGLQDSLPNQTKSSGLSTAKTESSRQKMAKKQQRSQFVRWSRRCRKGGSGGRLGSRTWLLAPLLMLGAGLLAGLVEIQAMKRPHSADGGDALNSPQEIPKPGGLVITLWNLTKDDRRTAPRSQAEEEKDKESIMSFKFTTTGIDERTGELSEESLALWRRLEPARLPSEGLFIVHLFHYDEGAVMDAAQNNLDLRVPDGFFFDHMFPALFEETPREQRFRGMRQKRKYAAALKEPSSFQVQDGNILYYPSMKGKKLAMLRVYVDKRETFRCGAEYSDLIEIPQEAQLLDENNEEPHHLYKELLGNESERLLIWRRVEKLALWRSRSRLVLLDASGLTAEDFKILEEEIRATRKLVDVTNRKFIIRSRRASAPIVIPCAGKTPFISQKPVTLVSQTLPLYIAYEDKGDHYRPLNVVVWMVEYERNLRPDVLEPEGRRIIRSSRCLNTPEAVKEKARQLVEIPTSSDSGLSELRNFPENFHIYVIGTDPDHMQLFAGEIARLANVQVSDMASVLRFLKLLQQPSEVDTHYKYTVGLRQDVSMGITKWLSYPSMGAAILKIQSNKTCYNTVTIRYPASEYRFSLFKDDISHEPGNVVTVRWGLDVIFLFQTLPLKEAEYRVPEAAVGESLKISLKRQGSAAVTDPTEEEPMDLSPSSPSSSNFPPSSSEPLSPVAHSLSSLAVSSAERLTIHCGDEEVLLQNYDKVVLEAFGVDFRLNRWELFGAYPPDPTEVEDSRPSSPTSQAFEVEMME